jgi:hypothetical protein
MGAGSSCPKGFDQGTGFSCHHQCPDQFKYVQQQNPLSESCVYISDNEFSFHLKELSIPNPKQPEPIQFEQERKRVQDEVANILNNLPVVDTVGNLKKDEEKRVIDHDAIKTQYAAFSSVAGAAKDIKDTSDSLRVMRPKTAPDSDYEKERQGILNIIRHKLIVIQIALFTIVICLIEYLVIPVKYVHGVALLTICTGAAVGIYLSNI